MKFSKPLKVEIIGFVISMPFIELAWQAILFEDRFLTDWRVWCFSWPLIYAIGIVSWYIHIQYDHFIRKKFPTLKETGKRIFLKTFVNPVVMVPSVLIIFFIYDYFSILGYHLRPGDLKWGYLCGLSVNLLFETLWEVLFLLNKYKESLLEKELLEKMSMEHEFESLKGQVNPHFLFNCFNTLSSLIEEDKEEADHFLNELSKVYRYLLRNNEDGISTVEKEIKFIESYFQLLKTRYGEGLQISLDIDHRYYPYQLPSLSLQLLVENAVKHNIISKQKPLMVEILTTEGNKLVVNNNLQQKSVGVQSTHIGLSNIRAKYLLMKQEGFLVVEGERNFMVVLPLIWNNG
ncbi:sensor histidine kinase [Chitinophaga eiseniae]|uniref:Histidine kinase n=1 Tax=Chitinophaga eiseniae TaxID=634771 RepID=A0A847SLF2_9BACT|nr:histidine kinase [Chitinophaga eiseniae]NLR80583.1 histidine kinase [Chitinophaga eiseniae]